MTTEESRIPTSELALQPPPVIQDPGAKYADDTRIFQGIPGLERAPGGRLWATWYGGGPTEGPWNFVMLVTSGDDGKTWSELQLVVDPPGVVRAFDPALWVSPDGRLWLFWAQAGEFWDGRAGVWAIVTDEPDSERPTWSAPRRLCDGIMMNKPVALSTGEWLLPAAIWTLKPKTTDPEFTVDLTADGGSNAVCSTDQGETWALVGSSDIIGRACDEHMIVERRDGSLWLLARTTYGIGESISTDRAKTWSPGTPSWIPHVPAARFFIRRLASGKLLLVKHHPPDGRTRSHLTAYLSDDDGRTWDGGLMIDVRGGVSYPDGVQAPDGTIYIIYDYQRVAAKQILMATFTEEDVLAGSFASAQARERVVINQATGDPTRDIVYAANEDGVELAMETLAAVAAPTCEPDMLVEKAKLFTDRAYVVRDLPPALERSPFLRGSITGVQGKCVQPGLVFVLTPSEGRNTDSLETQLLGDGFQKVKLPEFVLFGEITGNVCSVFQKRLSEGDEVVLGKWGVLIAASAE